MAEIHKAKRRWTNSVVFVIIRLVFVAYNKGANSLSYFQEWDFVKEEPLNGQSGIQSLLAQEAILSMSGKGIVLIAHKR